MYSHSQTSFIKSNMSITDKQTDEALSAQLREKHGPFWYTYVKDTPDDTQKAKDLRQKRESVPPMVVDCSGFSLWSKPEQELEARRAKMTKKERILDEMREDFEDAYAWDALCAREESWQYQVECFRNGKMWKR